MLKPIERWTFIISAGIVVYAMINFPTASAIVFALIVCFVLFVDWLFND